MFVSEIYALKDCWKYLGQTWTKTNISAITLNESLPSTNYKIEFELIITNSDSVADVQLGTTSGGRVVMGYNVEYNPHYQLIWLNNSVQSTTLAPLLNTWETQELTVKNGVVTYNGLSVTPTNVDLTNLVYIALRNASIRNIKVTPL